VCIKVYFSWSVLFGSVDSFDALCFRIDSLFLSGDWVEGILSNLFFFLSGDGYMTAVDSLFFGLSRMSDIVLYFDKI
jgi:hypothetical protein